MADASHLVRFHCFTNSVTGSVMNDLQPLMNRRLEPVMKACQGQHLSIPVRGKTQDYLNKLKAEEKAEFPSPR